MDSWAVLFRIQIGSLFIACVNSTSKRFTNIRKTLDLELTPGGRLINGDANMKISEVSEQYDISPDTMRYYKRVGSIPTVDRNNAGSGITASWISGGLNLSNVCGVRGSPSSCWNRWLYGERLPILLTRPWRGIGGKDETHILPLPSEGSIIHSRSNSGTASRQRRLQADE